MIPAGIINLPRQQTTMASSDGEISFNFSSPSMARVLPSQVYDPFGFDQAEETPQAQFSIPASKGAKRISKRGLKKRNVIADSKANLSLLAVGCTPPRTSTPISRGGAGPDEHECTTSSPRPSSRSSRSRTSRSQSQSSLLHSQSQSRLSQSQSQLSQSPLQSPQSQSQSRSQSPVGVPHQRQGKGKANSIGKENLRRTGARTTSGLRHIQSRTHIEDVSAIVNISKTSVEHNTDESVFDLPISPEPTPKKRNQSASKRKRSAKSPKNSGKSPRVSNKSPKQSPAPLKTNSKKSPRKWQPKFETGSADPDWEKTKLAELEKLQAEFGEIDDFSLTEDTSW
eukprot:m.84141 g.84141  ORF g.84141 m.84141 type:complete len:340 (-) comp25713_c0_seq1:90-1109(-)